MGGAAKDHVLDLSVVDQAYGDYADLYSDVLRVSVVATHEQIQLAYFDRRSELFTLLAKIDAKSQDARIAKDRFQAERKMDSVVLAVRILGDPDQRLVYDRMRQERLLNRRRAEHGQLPGHEARVDAGLDQVVEEENTKKKVKLSSRRKELRDRSTEPVESPKKKDKKEKKKAKKVKKEEPPPEEDSRGDLNRSIETMEASLVTDDTERGMNSVLSDTDEMRQDDTNTLSCGGTTDYDNYSLTSRDQERHSGMLSCISNSRILSKISDEISGACEDTLVSVDQVFNAFTLTDRDIRAVTKKIDKAKRQLDN